MAAGVVLAGGRSSRMGRPKAELEWHGTTLLFRTAAVLVRATGGPVVVVRAPGQRLPALPAGVEVVADPAGGLGPLQGIAAGLAAVRDRAGEAFVCSTDLPFLHPAYVRAVLRGLADPAVDLVLPSVRGFPQPLAAAYRTRLADLVAARVAAGQLRVSALPDACTAVRPGEADLLADPELAGADPGLDSVRNVNTPAEYAAARARAAPLVTVRGPGGDRTVAAATLGAAGPGATLGGATDPRLPLAAGDVVVLSP
jgi:molybdenum cofactor guanylyltransferase